MTQQPARIVILGGGFGGLYTALRLNELPWNQSPEIVLVDQRDRFLFSPLLYELLTGELQTWEIAPPYGELLADTRIRFVQSAVSSIDVEGKRVQLETGATLEFDRLVLSLGGEAPLEIVPGAEEFAIPFRTIEDANRLQERLRQLEQSDKDKIRVAIVGAGYSGVELACKLADRLGERGRFRLIERSDKILATSADFNRDAATKALDDRKVWVDLETEVDSISADTISIGYKGQIDTIPVDIVLWTIGTKVAQVVQELPLKHSQRGQVVVTPTLQAVDLPDVFAIGDLAECRDADGQLVPGTAQAAFQQAEYCGWNVWASLSATEGLRSTRPLLPFRYQYLGEMMTLGTDDATFSGLGIKLDGQLAYVARRLAYLYRMPTFDHQLKVGLNWIAQPIRKLLAS
ncbi:MAG: NAD(P)/FAD-dependent oxidoreductase [Leptolyngbyaceae cyanobacterium SM1_3_5]|nr:NAD(P)/FAD-dependent oxidoreductase [Leptolyngbyaceae cyanobacterium SM1_3_5]